MGTILPVVGKYGLLLLLFFVFLNLGCAGKAGRVHTDDEPIKDIEASNVDLSSMSREMAAALIEVDVIAQHPGAVVIAFPKITNRTHDVDFDSAHIQSMIREQLTTYSHGKIQFIDSELSNLVYAQRDACRAGTMACGKRADMPGATYFLKGHASSRHQIDPNGVKLAYHRYAFRLTDAETGIVVWEKDYEFKKVGQRGIVYR